jgi:hypothetical protein
LGVDDDVGAHRCGDAELEAGFLFDAAAAADDAGFDDHCARCRCITVGAAVRGRVFVAEAEAAFELFAASRAAECAECEYPQKRSEKDGAAMTRKGRGAHESDPKTGL